MSKAVFKRLIKQLLPPFIFYLYGRLSGGGNTWKGDYDSWASAIKDCTGYDSQAILDKVCKSQREVVEGRAVYERDSVLFERIYYSWPMLAGLMWVAARQNSLKVLDFGGSLGSTYYQNRRFFSGISVEWNIVEQELFVAKGVEEFETSELRFFSSIDDCIKEKKPDLVLLSSVLPYIERPYDFIDSIIKKRLKYVLIDRTPLFMDSQRLSVQVVPKEIYDASYPCWVLDESKIVNLFLKQYELVADFDSDIDQPFGMAKYRGFIFRLK